MAFSEFELRQLIHAAFIDAPYPADGYDIYAAQTDDDYGAPIFTTEHLPGRKWYEITEEQLLDCPAAFSYLAPEGWRHYLPAALLLELSRPYSNINVLWQLRRPEAPADQRMAARHATLDRQQTAAVVSFIETYIARESNIHATHAHALYAKSGITWTPKLDPWPRLAEKTDMLMYWQERLAQFTT